MMITENVAARVTCVRDGPVATVTLNRPEKLNAIDPAMLAQLETIVHEIEGSRELRVVLLTGVGDRAFSVGADITAWSALAPLEMWRQWIRDGHRVFERIARLPQPVIAVLNGYTFGGGLELALAADLRIAAEGIELAFPEVKIATIPGWGGTQRLPALIGSSRAKRMIFTGSRIDAGMAERWGLVDVVAPRDHLLDVARQIAGEIAANAPASVQMAKQLVDGGNGWATGVTLEALAGALSATTADAREGAASFRERRTPRFSGE